MELLLIGLGVAALVPAILCFAIGVAMWNAWWLHPLWSLIIVPLGVPQITYWHFVALVTFLASVHRHTPPTDYAREQDKKTRTTNAVSALSLSFLSPMLVYYFARWVMR